MKELKIYGTWTDDGFDCRTAAGSTISLDSWNTIMQVLKQSIDRGGVLIWDEGTWDNYVWA